MFIVFFRLALNARLARDGSLSEGFLLCLASARFDTVTFLTCLAVTSLELAKRACQDRILLFCFQ
ncbi:hypothetical protein A2U01_0078029 [Trifolium medium]|uniref:Uncharacterized protein n=1 Tax=Trifolium medium TaxID=97028 RepID=A0A392T6U1_9FABA|nr:hypothetical protein [Trifolium medium]